MDNEQNSLAQITADAVPNESHETANHVGDKPNERTFTQAELDEIVSKRLAKERRKLERELSNKQSPKPADIQIDLKPESFETPEKYAYALAEKLAEEREKSASKAKIDEKYSSLEDEAREKYEDFEQVAYSPNLPITNAMAEVIKSSDIGPELAYFLGKNPKEAARISKLSPVLQAKELGKLETKISATPQDKPQTSAAPAPIKPVNSGRLTGKVTDTTDPRAAKDLSASEWIKAERERQIAKLKKGK